MVPVKEAVASAIEFASELLGAKSVTLEEVDLSADKQSWLITLGFVRTPTFVRTVSDDIPDILSALRGTDGVREYKIFEVDVESGQTMSMKIRELARAS